MSKGSHLSARKRAERASREERLAQALRDNLRRRKDQMRARDTRAAAPDTSPDILSEPDTSPDISNSGEASGLSGGPLSTKSNRHGGTTAD
jgi:hypothetical protein